MGRMNNMQAWCTNRLLISYNTSVGFIAVTNDNSEKYLILRDYASRTTRKQIAVWLENFGDLEPNESDYILNILREQRLKDYRLFKESLERYYIFDLSENPFEPCCVVYSWTDRGSMVGEKIYRHILSFESPTI